MSKIVGITLIVIAVLALAGGFFFFGTMFGRTNAFLPAMMSRTGWNNNAYGPGMMDGYARNNNGYGPGMMGGYGRNNDNSYGPGMMGGYSQNDGNGFGPGSMMGGYGRNNNNGFGPGMMGGYGANGMMGTYGSTETNLAPLTIDQAKAAAAKYLATLNDSDLAIADVMIFDNNAYVAVKETSTGIGAFELLVDPTSGIAYPEHGANMMWNLKYSALNHQGMMGGRGYGMMGGWSSQSTLPTGVSADMPVTNDKAIQAAQAFLDANIAGAIAAQDPMQFYGYYTIDFSKDGKIAGMLSVNGYSGQVLLHTWHGTFIEEAE